MHTVAAFAAGGIAIAGNGVIHSRANTLYTGEADITVAVVEAARIVIALYANALGSVMYAVAAVATFVIVSAGSGAINRRANTLYAGEADITVAVINTARIGIAFYTNALAGYFHTVAALATGHIVSAGSGAGHSHANTLYAGEADITVAVV